VVDLVLPIGSIASIVGYEGSFNIVEVAAKTSSEISSEYLREALPQPEMWSFQLLAGSPDPKQANELDISCIPLIIDSMRRSFDYVFVDLGKSLSQISLPIIQAADQIVVILSLDEATAKLTYSVWDFLKSKGIRKEQVYMLINRAVGLEGFSKSEVEEQLGLVITNAIPFMGREFTLANNLHQPILHKFPDDAATIAMRQAVREIHQRAEVRIKAPDLF
jgi:MinD-like ATPase involved in chromosome partitioning or flagellar assembly